MNVQQQIRRLGLELRFMCLGMIDGRCYSPGMTSRPGRDYLDFLEVFLPEFDGRLTSHTSVEESLAELRDFYAQASTAEEWRQSTPGRVAVVVIEPWRDWVTEVKAASLWADLIVCDDPLLNIQDRFGAFAFSIDRDLGSAGARERMLIRLKEQYDNLWKVFPMVQQGLLIFRHFRADDDGTQAAIKQSVIDHLARFLEVGNFDLTCYPRWADYRLPLLQEELTMEIDSALLSDFGMSVREIVEFNIEKRLTLEALTTWNGLLVADEVNGTFWAGSRNYWNLARDAVHGLSPNTRILSFVEACVRPSLENMPVDDLLRVRNDEDAFRRFRRELSSVQHLMKFDPDDEGFAGNVADLFDEVFRPNIRMIESAIKSNTLTRRLPMVAASVGLSIAAGTTSGSPAISTLYATLAGVVGLPIFKSGVAGVRGEPAFILWKLGVPSS